MMKIMILSVHSGIQLHSLSESYLIKELQSYSIQISYVTCGETFSEFCHVMPELFFLKNYRNIFLKILIRIVNKVFPKTAIKYELSKKMTNNEDSSKLITMLKNGHDSLFEQLQSEVNLNIKIESEFVAFINKVRNNEL